MRENLTECPNCHTTLKSGMFSYVVLLESEKIRLINAVQNADAVGYCNKCGDQLYQQSTEKVQSEMEDLRKAILNDLNSIPVISAQSPQGWEYDVLVMVTGQSVTGTGVFSEFTSSITDLFGGQSGAYATKLKMGEQLCFAQLRKKVLDYGGNAVIATDIDYSEVGGDKGMLMVCMAGTAIRIKNDDVLGETRAAKIKELTAAYKRLFELQNLVTKMTNRDKK